MSNPHKRYSRSSRQSAMMTSSHQNHNSNNNNSASSQQQHQTQHNNNDGNTNIDDSNHIYTPLPKHIPFPDVPHSSEILNEIYIFLFTIVSAAAQFMHLYRTVWWLPDSYTNHTMNLYLIDPYLVIFIALMVGRRLLFCIITKIMEYLCPEKILGSAYNLCRIFFTIILVTILGCCTLKIFQNHSYVYTICLCYPLILYAAIFGLHIEPFLRTINETETAYFNQIPLHCCSTNPNSVRQEVDNLIIDFNNRFKQVIFTSVVNAYYAGFIPCFFAQKFLYYDIYWTIQHLAFIWASVFAMCVIYCFPAKYADILHRSALHLGQWSKIETRSNLSNPIAWAKTMFWPSGTIVKYSEKCYKSIGHITSAIPSNSSHFRFYFIFHNPSILYLILTIIQLLIVLLQIIILYFLSIEWHNTISLTFLLFVNHTSLFKLIRDCLITHKIYTAESSIYKKINLTNN